MPLNSDTWTRELNAGVDYLEENLSAHAKADHTSPLSDFINSVTPNEGRYGRVATPGAGVTAKLTPDSPSGVETIAGNLYDTDTDGVCAHVAVTFHRYDGTADPAYRTYLCDAHSASPWTVTSRKADGDYWYAEVAGDNGPTVTRLFPLPPEAYFADDNSECSANTRVGDTTSIYDAAGTYFGWAEWRQGTSGACRGYQWARLHVTQSIPLTEDHPARPRVGQHPLLRPPGRPRTAGAPDARHPRGDPAPGHQRRDSGS